MKTPRPGISKAEYGELRAVARCIRLVEAQFEPASKQPAESAFKAVESCYNALCDEMNRQINNYTQQFGDTVDTNYRLALLLDLLATAAEE